MLLNHGQIFEQLLIRVGAQLADDEKYQRFLALPPATQDTLRLLNQQLSSGSDGARLRQVMQRYYDWLKTLTPAEQAELASQPNDDARVTKVEEIRHKQQAKAAGSHMAPTDLTAITEWVKKYAADHESELRHDFPHRHASPGGNSGASQSRAAQARAWFIWTRDRLPHISHEEIDALAAKLSQTPRAAINSKATYPEKEKLLQDWLQAIARTRFASRQGKNATPAMLTKFFQSLPKDEQKRLMEISDPEQRRHELGQDYRQAHPRSGRMHLGPGEDNGPHFDGPDHLGPPPGKHFEPDDSDAPASPKK